MTDPISTKKDFVLYGDRVALIPTPEQYEGKIAVPEGYRSSKTHDLGVVKYVGDGIVNGEGKVMFVGEGDVVLFQMNAILGSNYAYKVKGEVAIILQQADLLAKISGKVVKMDSFQILGHWILAKAHASSQISTIQIPDAHLRKDRFQVVQTGSEVKNCQPGDWIVPNMQFCNAIQVGDESDLFYLQDSYVYGIVTPD